jgi:bifunctional pyridoxal-dependent enzyme with beta-cystathionase and maltose regulon repressor activities
MPELEATYLVWLDFRPSARGAVRPPGARSWIVPFAGRAFGAAGYARLNIGCARPLLEEP